MGGFSGRFMVHCLPAFQQLRKGPVDCKWNGKERMTHSVDQNRSSASSFRSISHQAAPGVPTSLSVLPFADRRRGGVCGVPWAVVALTLLGNFCSGIGTRGYRQPQRESLEITQDALEGQDVITERSSRYDTKEQRYTQTRCLVHTAQKGAHYNARKPWKTSIPRGTQQRQAQVRSAGRQMHNKNEEAWIAVNNPAQLAMARGRLTVERGETKSGGGESGFVFLSDRNVYGWGAGEGQSSAVQPCFNVAPPAGRAPIVHQRRKSISVLVAEIFQEYELVAWIRT
ncbi:hypothetical protein F5148DRAFT_1147879 [Russula earlei]|uniref:Uncharacterized protein n=1 Tax=Russula earlei TaxID=71964 RepID=A0ACC0UFW5_9AGAM|nr:hypothetical protein F5148DRAFT_1147879 [Russula earlei]